MNRGGGDEKVAFEDWKRNPYAFPVEDIINFQGNPVEFYIDELKTNFTGALGGTILGIADTTIASKYNSTVEEFFNINYNDFKEISNASDANAILDTIVLLNNCYIENRKEQFHFIDLFEELYNNYNLSYLEANTITKGKETDIIFLIKFIEKNNVNNIFYTTGISQSSGGGR